MLRYLGIIFGMLLVIALAAVSTYLAWPWLMSEHMRLTRTELIFTNLAEEGSLVLFLYSLVKFMITRETDSAFDEDIAHAPGMQFLAFVVILSAAIDLGATFYFQARATALRESAVEGTAEITKIKKYFEGTRRDTRGTVVGNRFCVLVWCDVIAENGQTYPTYYYGKQTRFPESVHEAIVYNRLREAEMPITYAPTFPRKFWVAGVEDDYMSIWRLSQEITIFALVFTLIVLAVNKVLFQTPVPLEICPFLGVTLRLAIAGWYMFFHDQTSIPPL